MSNATPIDEESTTSTGTQWSRINWAFIGLFTALTVIGVAISTGVFGLGIVNITDPGTNTGVRTPMYVYLYSSLGALGYIFTKLMTRLEDFDEWGEIE